MKKNQLLLRNCLFDGHVSTYFILGKNLKTLLIMAVMLLSVSWAQAVDYYLTSAGAGAAQTPGSWNTIPGGGGTSPANFVTGNNTFTIPSGINGVVTGNWLIGDIVNANNQNITLTIQGSLTINSGVTLTLQQKNSGTNTVTVTGGLIFSGTTANQFLGTISGNGTAARNTLILSTGATLKTVNTSGIVASTGTASINSTNVTVTLNTSANYEFNGAVQSTTGLPATVNNLTFSGTGAKTLATNVQVNGIYSVENGSNANIYTGTLSYGSGATLQYNSTGARTPGTEWVTPFTATGGVVINNTGVVTLSVSKTVDLLTIAPNAKFTFNTGTLTVTTFNIQSGDAGTGTYIGSGTLSATTTNVQQYHSIARNWYMSTPVNGGNIPTAGYRYNETVLTNYWENVTSGSTMTDGKGYIVMPLAPGTVTFSGTLNNGDKSITGLTNTSTAYRPGYNLVGNPYPSYIDWDAATKTNLLNTMWYRTQALDNSGNPVYNLGIPVYAFVTYSGGFGVPSQYNVTNKIPPMQAFWVKVNVNSPLTGTLGFLNTSRSHKVDANILRAPAAKTSENQILRLQVSNGTTTDEAVVYFNTNADDGFDAYDSPKMVNGTSSRVPDIYTKVGAEVLVINGMNTIPYETEIPLYFAANASVGASYTISATQFSNFEAGTQVWIKNTLSGVPQLISDGSPFTFDLTETGTNPKFSIIIKAPGTATQLANSNNSNIVVFANANNQINVTCNDAISTNATVTVYNGLGQRIARKALTGNVTLIDNPMTSGVYMVTVNNAGNKSTEKIIIR